MGWYVRGERFFYLDIYRCRGRVWKGLFWGLGVISLLEWFFCLDIYREVIYLRISRGR